MSPWIELLKRQTPEAGPVDWNDIVVGQDFGFLTPEDIVAWCQAQCPTGPDWVKLAALEGEGLLEVESHLWAACREATGKTPRPGGLRWERAQDRWRVALLRDAMDTPLAPEALAMAVETIYERVGCPDDMLPLWTWVAPWERRPREPRIEAIRTFIQRRSEALAQAG